MAMRTRRLVPVIEIGLMPMPESSRIFFLALVASITLLMKSMSFLHSGVPSRHSIPEYTSSVFSRKITMFIRSGCFTGDGMPL